MFKARYYKADGKKGRAQRLPEPLFDGVVNEGVMHQAVNAYLANQRQGTGAAKTRSQVSGGNRKPWRQKGTGRARQGSTRAAQWDGGGRAFPPIPHSWRQRLNRKMRALARRSAFNARAQDERVVVIDSLSLEKPRTAEFRNYLSSIDLADAKVLMLTDGVREAVYLSSRNLPKVQVRAFGQESVYELLWADMVVIERDALARLKPEPVEEEAGKEAAADDPQAVAEATAAPRKRKTPKKKPALETQDESGEKDDDA